MDLSKDEELERARNRKFDHHYIGTMTNVEKVEKDAWRSAYSGRPQMLHNHPYGEQCTPTTKCREFHVEVSYIGKS